MAGALHLVTGPAYPGPWPSFVRGYLIDIVLPFAMFLVLGTIRRPVVGSPGFRAAALFSFGATVELLQFLGHPVLGRTADVLDLVAYATGILAGVVFERMVLARLPDASSPGDPRRRLPTGDGS
jgi:hypothetical protein